MDLLPPDHLMSKQPSNLKLPVSLEVKTGLGPTGSEFEVRLILSPPLPTQGSSNSASSSLSSIRNSRVGGGSSGGPSFGGNSTPKSNLEGLRVSIPLPAEVRNLSEVRASRGDTKYAPGAETLEWVIPVKEAGSGTATLRATCIGHSDDVEEEDEADTFKFSLYDGADAGGYQTSGSPRKREVKEVPVEQERDMKKVARNKLFMPSSARVSFGIKGWLASGLRVEGLIIDQRKSRGVEGGMKLFKGVKYLTASRGGVEVRC